MFETVVKQYVLITLNSIKVKAEFFSGTLFVRTITEQEANAVLHVLIEKVGAVEMNAIGDTGEYAYDFI